MNRNEMSIESITGTMRWAEQCIKEFKAEDFDPLAMLMDTETVEQKMASECAVYLAEIERLTEDFRKARIRIAMERR